MKIKSLFLSLIGLLFTPLCNKTTESIFWVSGYYVDCDGGSGKMKCLKIHRGENFAAPNWEYFYAPIDGFEMEEGLLKKILIKEEKLDVKQVPADASSIKYTQIKVLETRKDESKLVQQRLHDIWNLSHLNGKEIKDFHIRPTMEINLTENKVMGVDGCNQYFGPINQINGKSLNFGMIAATKKYCPHMDLANQFNKALSSVESYNLVGLNLYLFDESENEILQFLKGD